MLHGMKWCLVKLHNPDSASVGCHVMKTSEGSRIRIALPQDCVLFASIFMNNAALILHVQSRHNTRCLEVCGTQIVLGAKSRKYLVLFVSHAYAWQAYTISI
jgi:hypothetical protein